MIKKNITMFDLFKLIFNCFIMSCGFFLIIIFFNNKLDVSKEIIRSMVFNIFFILLFINILTKLLSKTVPIIQQPISYGIASLKENISYEENEINAEYNLNISMIHEAGHMLICYLNEIEIFNVNVSYISAKVCTIYKNQNADDIKNNILMLYGGAVAEELILGEFHYGCVCGNDSDFSKATDLLKSYIIMKDMSKSKSLLESELSNEIINLSKQFYNECKEIIIDHKVELNIIIETLKKNKGLTKREVEHLFKNIK